jgi:solute carrier family 25 protein 34/35
MDTAVLMFDGALASCGAAVFSNPFDVIKIRMQLQGELMKRGAYAPEYTGMLQGIYKVGSLEGIAALQKGLVPSFFHQISQNGVRLGIYPTVKRECEVVLPRGDLLNIVAGAVAGVFGAVASSPFFMIKTRLQAQNIDPKHAVGEQHHYKGFRDAFERIVREKGVRGLYQGLQAACLRTAVGSAAQLATYDGGKKRACEYLGAAESDVRVHFFAAAWAAAAITLFMNPLDVLMTRSFNNSQRHYSNNLFRALLEIAKVEGVQGLYKGSAGLWSRTAPHTIFTFLFLEQLRALRMTIAVTSP